MDDRAVFIRGPALEDMIGPREAVRADEGVAVVCADGCIHRAGTAVGVINERVGVGRPCGADGHIARHVGGDPCGVPSRESVAGNCRGRCERARRPLLVGGGVRMRRAAQVFVCDGRNHDGLELLPGARASTYWCLHEKTFAKDATRTGEKRGFSSPKTLASAYRNRKA